MKLAKRIFLAIVIVLALSYAGLLRLNHLSARPIEVSEFSWFNKVEIYTVYVAMNVLGPVIYPAPEAGLEGLLMLFPFNDGKVKTFESDFFLQSEFILDKIHNYSKPVRLAWPPSAYLWGSPEARVALTLNTGTLSIEDGKVRVSVPCAWPKHSDHRDHSWTTPLVSIPGLPEIRVQEGLFWVLEQEGWIYPYTAVWEADLPD